MSKYNQEQVETTAINVGENISEMWRTHSFNTKEFMQVLFFSVFEHALDETKSDIETREMIENCYDCAKRDYLLNKDKPFKEDS